jgi:hypothetical protein
MRLNRLYVVTYPTSKSEICDILFETDMIDLELQFKGGLSAKNIAAVFSEHEEAYAFALNLLNVTSRIMNSDVIRQLKSTAKSLKEIVDKYGVARDQLDQVNAAIRSWEGS